VIFPASFSYLEFKDVIFESLALFCQVFEVLCCSPVALKVLNSA
jgi:hypothetical protein